MNARGALVLALAGLVGLYAVWFGYGANWVALFVFGLPPLILALLLRSVPRHASFLSGILALLWFSHGVMVAWSRPPERGYAWVEIVLALAVILAGNIEAMRHRFGRRTQHP